MPKLWKLGRWFTSTKPELSSQEGYSLWAKSYGKDPNNLMLYLDQELMDEFLSEISLNDQRVLDVVCGNGRYWARIGSYGPRKLVGCDISGEMLSELTTNFPDAEVYQINDHILPFASESFDVIVSTLTLGHIPDLPAAFKEVPWIPNLP